MPLVRFTVKNEYGLGVEELYKDGVQSEDPKAVLDGVAVAGLVGVLRQLGDLAQYVFFLISSNNLLLFFLFFFPILGVFSWILELVNGPS